MKSQDSLLMPAYTVHRMPTIHPTAALEGDVQLAADVAIGPHCVLTGPITIGAGTRLIGNVYLQGPLTMGCGNVVYPFACLGFAPQHAKFDPNTPGSGLTIGDNNTFREHVTIHRAFEAAHPTRIGSRNLFMVNSHAGHDCVVGDHCTLVNNSALGGHVQMQDRVTLGGGAVVHQFCRIGRGAMLSGAMGTSRDLPPWFMLTGNNLCGSINLVGMRRSGMSRDEIDAVKWVYRTLYREGYTINDAVEELKSRAGEPLIDEYIAFIESSDRGICDARGRAIRGSATELS